MLLEFIRPDAVERCARIRDYTWTFHSLSGAYQIELTCLRWVWRQRIMVHGSRFSTRGLFFLHDPCLVAMDRRKAGSRA